MRKSNACVKIVAWSDMMTRQKKATGPRASVAFPVEMVPY